jgi:hypothetical protein
MDHIGNDNSGDNNDQHDHNSAPAGIAGCWVFNGSVRIDTHAGVSLKNISAHKRYAGLYPAQNRVKR